MVQRRSLGKVDLAVIEKICIIISVVRHFAVNMILECSRRYVDRRNSNIVPNNRYGLFRQIVKKERIGPLRESVVTGIAIDLAGMELPKRNKNWGSQLIFTSLKQGFEM